jgi:hypothetical protein
MFKVLGILAAMVLALPGIGTHGHQTTTPRLTTADAALIANEQALYAAITKADKATFLSLVLPEGTWTTPRGFVPLNLLAGALRTFNLTKWDIVNPHVTWLDKDAAIVSYALQASGTFEDQTVPPTALASTAWMKRDGNWIAAHHQETELAR